VALQPRREEALQPVPPGSYKSAAIVLLTDGQNSIGPEPVDAAQAAANRGVKVYTVGFGTRDGQELGFDGFSILVRLDEDTLQKIADVTRAEYFHAGSGAELDRVYAGLESRLVVEERKTEITSLFAAAAALLLAAVAVAAIGIGRLEVDAEADAQRPMRRGRSAAFARLGVRVEDEFGQADQVIHVERPVAGLHLADRRQECEHRDFARIRGDRRGFVQERGV
jgi:hypothetical protein